MFEVLITYTDCPVPVATHFYNEREALAFINEEQKWENTLRLQCDALGVDVTGSFH